MTENKHFVVYTVVVGGYDDVLQPLVVDDRFDYVLFTDNNNIFEGDRDGVWKIRKIDYRDEDNARMSRYPKMHPEELLFEYEASLYIDANIQIIGEWVYERFMELYDKGVEWGGIWLRNSVYDESLYVLLSGFDKGKRVLEWSHRLRFENFPREYDSYENNVIFRRNCISVKAVNEYWWTMYLSNVRRDQLYLSYAFWRNPALIKELFLHKGTLVHDTHCFRRLRHNSSYKKQWTWIHPYNIWLRLMNNYSRIRVLSNNIYYRLSGLNSFVGLLLIDILAAIVFVLYSPFVFFGKLLRGGPKWLVRVVSRRLVCKK